MKRGADSCIARRGELTAAWKQRAFAVGCALSLASSMLAGAGCTTGDLSSEPTPPDAAVPTGSAPPGDGLADSPPGVVRTVEVRNPVGAPFNNLMYDGDFELSISPSPQGLGYWYAFTGSQQPIKSETGGLCRTGLRCAVLEPALVLYGRAAAAPDGASHDVSIWVRPPEDADRCKVMDAYLLPCDQFQVLSQLEVPEEPDASGWCQYRGEYPPSQTAVCVYLEATLLPEETALIDAVTILPKGTASPNAKSGPTKSGQATDSVAQALAKGRTADGFVFGSPARLLPAGRAARMKQIIETVRTSMPFMREPPQDLRSSRGLDSP